jgi:hypothetical protein
MIIVWWKPTITSQSKYDYLRAEFNRGPYIQVRARYRSTSPFRESYNHKPSSKVTAYKPAESNPWSKANVTEGYVEAITHCTRMLLSYKHLYKLKGNVDSGHLLGTKLLSWQCPIRNMWRHSTLGYSRIRSLETSPPSPTLYIFVKL